MSKCQSFSNLLTSACLIGIVGHVLIGSSASHAQCSPDETAKLLGSDSVASDNFGQSVAISAGLGLVGAPWNDENGSNDGAAYLYQNNGGVWEQVIKLGSLGTTSGEFFGWSVAISGNTALIGARYDSQNGGLAGAAYVFRETAPGTWTQIAKLLADDGASGDTFGVSVALERDTAVIGARAADDNGSNSGSAYVFRETAPGTWTQIAKLLPSDGAAGDEFGWRLDFDGTTAIVGAHLHDVPATDAGAAYLFRETSPGTWSQIEKITASDAAANAQFGISVAIDGGTAVVGAPRYNEFFLDNGMAYVFRESDPVRGTMTWSQIAMLVPSENVSGDAYGGSVAISGDRIAVASGSDDEAASNAGAVYLFQEFPKIAPGQWDRVAKIIASDASSGDSFAYSMAFDGDTLLVGAPFDSDNGSSSGSAYIFDLSTCDQPSPCSDSWEVAIGTPGFDDIVFELAEYSGTIVAGGDFTTASGNNANHVAQWDGNNWQPLGDGLSTTVESLIEFDGDLIAGGFFNTVQRWNGTTWQTMGTVNNVVRDLTLHNGELVACGAFTTIGGASANRIAKWNGSAWSALNCGIGGTTQALLEFPQGGGDLIVAGVGFINGCGFGTITANGVAIWSGCPPEPPGPGDITGDGTVNVNDLLSVINAWGPCPAPPAACAADIAPAPDGNGVVNVNDLLMVINNWG